MVAKIKAVCTKNISVFNTKLSKNPALVQPMVLEVEDALWCKQSNKGPARNQTLEKQAEVQKQVLAMLANEVISVSQAEFYSQVHLTPKPVYEAPNKAVVADNSCALASIPLALH